LKFHSGLLINLVFLLHLFTDFRRLTDQALILWFRFGSYSSFIDENLWSKWGSDFFGVLGEGAKQKNHLF
jgi:hypothetical protein